MLSTMNATIATDDNFHTMPVSYAVTNARAAHTNFLHLACELAQLTNLGCETIETMLTITISSATETASPLLLGGINLCTYEKLGGFHYLILTATL